MNKKIYLFQFFIFLVLILASCSNEEKLKDINLEETEQKIEEPTKEEEPIVSTVKIIATGDLLISNSLINDAKTDQGFNFKPMFELVEPYIKEADISIANQETMIGGNELGLSGYPSFNSPYELGDNVKDLGYDVVTMANNHSLDRGEKGIINATNYWDKLGIVRTGAFQSQKDRDTIRVFEKNGISFSILSYTYGTNGIPIPKGKEYLVNLINLDDIKKDLTKAKQLSDIQIVAMHIGYEYERLPNEEQKEWAKKLTEQGADIIIGNHSHVLQPPAWIETDNGNKAYVMYSLGNFISSQTTTYRQIGGIAGIEVEKKEIKGNKTFKIKNPSFLPTYTYYKNWRNFKIYPMKEIDDSILNDSKTYYEEIKTHMKTYIKELEIIE